jgi:hypothetical protein
MNLDIQIQIWIDALTDLEDFFNFGCPNGNMDRCKEKLLSLLSYLDIQIQKCTVPVLDLDGQSKTDNDYKNSVSDLDMIRIWMPLNPIQI